MKYKVGDRIKLTKYNDRILVNPHNGFKIGNIYKIMEIHTSPFNDEDLRFYVYNLKHNEQWYLTEDLFKAMKEKESEKDILDLIQKNERNYYGKEEESDEIPF